VNVARESRSSTSTRTSGPAPAAPAAPALAYGSSEEANAFINEHFDANPLGVEFEPDEWLARLRAGEPEVNLMVRQGHEPVSPVRGAIGKLVAPR